MDMVKRVADAINAEMLKPWDETIGGPKQSERLALAAMRAMDEPTGEMLRDGAAKLRYFTEAQGPYPRTRAVYREMVRSALGVAK